MSLHCIFIVTLCFTKIKYSVSQIKRKFRMAINLLRLHFLKNRLNISLKIILFVFKFYFKNYFLFIFAHKINRLSCPVRNYLNSNVLDKFSNSIFSEMNHYIKKFNSIFSAYFFMENHSLLIVSCKLKQFV